MNTSLGFRTRSRCRSVALTSVLLLSACGSEPVDVRVLSISLTPEGPISVAVGDTVQLEATVHWSETPTTTPSIRWQSSDDEVLRPVEPGTFRAEAAGSASVTASVASTPAVESSVDVKVSSPEGDEPDPNEDSAVESVSVSPRGPIELSLEGSVALTATVVAAPGASPDLDIAWSAAPTGVVEVTGTGTVWARAPGTALVTATSVAEPDETDTIEISVPDPLDPGIRVAPLPTVVPSTLTFELEGGTWPAGTEATWSFGGESVEDDGEVATVLVNTAGDYDIAVTLVAPSGFSKTIASSVLASGFGPTGSLQQPRSNAVAAVTPDGSILVTDGRYPHESTVAELYDPATQTSIEAHDHPVTLGANPVAVPLADNSILLVSRDGVSYHFDPVTASFTSVALAGTSDFGSPVAAFGARSDGTYALATESGICSNRATYYWTIDIESAEAVRHARIAPRVSMAFTELLDDRLLGVGGVDFYTCDAGSASDATTLFDPLYLSSAPGPSLVELASWSSAYTAEDGSVVVTGSPAALQVLPAGSGNWAQSAIVLDDAPTRPRLIALPNGRALLLGAFSDDTAYEYDPGTDTIEPVGSFPSDLYGYATVEVPGGAVLIIGGRTNTTTGTNVVRTYFPLPR